MGAGRYDVIVVGARVAGAATAMLLARQGLRVLAVDRVPPALPGVPGHRPARERGPARSRTPA